ncbi:hypothetical protein [Paenarthrobacter sp. C1]|uniref:hypothetical protein n=1 Tax=Paenarthrobacter sp. C1 TaxID=3400220 RepID=UPI003BF60760
MTYTPPATQQDLDRIIEERLARVRTQQPADYDEIKAKAGQTEALQARITELETTNGELTNQMQASQRTALLEDISRTKGVPADALRGSTREELETHADQIAAITKPSGPVIPGQERTPGQLGPNQTTQFLGELFN